MSLFKKEPVDRLIRAKIRLMDSHPFLGLFSFNLRFMVDTHGMIEAYENTILDKEGKPAVSIPMGIDPFGNIYYIPEKLGAYDDDQLYFILAHEVCHQILKHGERVGNRIEQVWGLSTDIATNLILDEDGFQVPPGCLINRKYKGWLSEEIYDDIMEKAEKVPTPCGSGPCIPENCPNRNKRRGSQSSPGDQKCIRDAHIQGEDVPQSIKDLPQPDLDKARLDAFEYAKSIGRLPATIARRWGAELEPKIPWNILLRNMILLTIPKDFTYTRPSKKTQAYGVYLPSVKKEFVEVFFGVDTSGSIGKDELDSFMTEIENFDRTIHGAHFYIITCDAKVHEAEDYYSGSPKLSDFKPSGGGGTAFTPVFEFLRENYPRAKLLVYFTDMFGDQQSLKPERYAFQTIWVITPKHGSPPPFGYVIEL